MPHPDTQYLLACALTYLGDMLPLRRAASGEPLLPRLLPPGELLSLLGSLVGCERPEASRATLMRPLSDSSASPTW